jgi:hypothetical protein
LNDQLPIGGQPTLEPSQSQDALRERIRAVIRLENAGKMDAAAEAMDAIPKGKVLGESALCKIAKMLEDKIIAQGGYGTAKAIANKLINRPLMKRILHGHAAEEVADKRAREATINAARAFLTDILSTRGRRTTVNSNAFWVVATALIPTDVLLNRQGRATMRLLGVNASTVRRAVQLRERVERDRTWEPVVAAKKKCIDPQPLIDWWHREGVPLSHRGRSHRHAQWQHPPDCSTTAMRM